MFIGENMALVVIMLHGGACKFAPRIIYQKLVIRHEWQEFVGKFFLNMMYWIDLNGKADFLFNIIQFWWRKNELKLKEIESGAATKLRYNYILHGWWTFFLPCKWMVRFDFKLCSNYSRKSDLVAKQMWL